MIVFSAIVPHPPVSIPGVGEVEDKNKLQQTMRAFEKLAEQLVSTKPDTIVIISPHAKMEADYFLVNGAVPLVGSFVDFGLDFVMHFDNDVEIADMIAFVGSAQDFPVYLENNYLDHGALVPLFHLLKEIDPQVVHLSFSLLDFKKHYEYGEILGQLFARSSKRIAIVASGDLSHCLTPNAPAGYSPRGVLFDRRLIGILHQQDFEGVLTLQNEIIREAAECGLRSFIILMGAISKEEKKHFELFSYEYPFGVGYLVARLL